MNNSELKDMWRELPTVFRVVLVLQVVGVLALAYVVMHFVKKLW